MNYFFSFGKTAFIIIVLLLFSLGFAHTNSNWKVKSAKQFDLFYKADDKNEISTYSKYIKEGTISTSEFIGTPFVHTFKVFVHPNRNSLDSTWQFDWKMPNFKSECWMVASGTGERLDMIAPKKWDKESCEHTYEELVKTRQLISHELMHVLHGQKNISSDFSNTDGIDWFVEGLATYSSGQCDSNRIAEIKIAIANKKTPESLANFWTGKLKYGLSGSMVMYIDKKYGRNKLKELLSFNKKADILAKLNLSEPELLEGWKKYMIEL